MCTQLPHATELSKLGFHSVILLLRALFVGEIQHGRTASGAPIPLGDIGSDGRRITLDTLRSLQRRGLITRSTRGSFAYVKLTDKGRANAEACSALCFGIDWRELNLAKYLFAGFKRNECHGCGAVFFLRGRSRTWCGLACKSALHNAQTRRQRMDARRKRVDIPDPVAAAFDLAHGDELSPFAESILYGEQGAPLVERECRECGAPFESEARSGPYCSQECFLIARRSRQNERQRRKRELAHA